MSGVEAFARMRRHIEFGRHVGIERVARRIKQQVERAFRDRLGVRALAPVGDLAIAARPPLPLFAPRKGQIEPVADAYRFTFLNRPIAMGPTVDWAAPGPTPRDQLWRMNLHYMEYLEAADDAGAIRLVEDWIDRNTPPGPGAWRDSFNSYAVSIRAVVWMQQLALRAARLSPDFMLRATASVAAQVNFLENNLETDIGGNHLVKNAKALIWASSFFIGAAAARWRGKGVDLLRAIITEQILSDGMHYERSPSYHCQVFADLLECRHALGVDPLGGTLDAALARMAQAAADLAHPDGSVALFNDAGLTMAYSPPACLAAYARVIGVAPAPRRIFALGSAGYFGLHEAGSVFVADCGPIAPDELVAHGHGDVLSFEWSVAGERIVVDQGVFEYNAGERRGVSKSAASHNTLCFEGADHADFFGAFRCGRRPNVRVLDYRAQGEGFVLEGTHDGFANLQGAPRHVRRFEATPESITIHDRIDGEAKQTASIGFLLHPDCTVTLVNGCAHILRNGVEVTAECTAPLSLEKAVWWPDMGVEIPTHRLRATLPAGNALAMTTRLAARTRAV